MLYLIATKDAFISRIFFFNFVPWLYVSLLFSHYYMPSLLARGIFRREEKTLLVGPMHKADQLRDWLRRKAEIGLRTVGIVCDTEGEQETYYLVGSSEADPRKGLISNESPIGRALMGKRVGDEVTVVAPAGAFNLKILEIS